MNLQEFAALKVGDKIENHAFGTKGEITQVNAVGVRVAWDGDPIADAAVTFQYAVNGTSWTHWSKVEDGT